MSDKRPSYCYDMWSQRSQSSLRLVQHESYGKRDIDNKVIIEIVQDGKILSFEPDATYLQFLINELTMIKNQDAGV